MESRILTDSMIKDFTRMILEGLVSLHNLGYVHCDLKPDNLLVFPRHHYNEIEQVSYDMKISDFGMSTEIGEDSDFWDFDSPFLGTPLYMSPQSVHNGFAEESLDLWSLGCIVLEMYTGESPWPFEELKELLTVLLNGKEPEIPKFVPWDARLFIQKCFAKERGSALELLKDPFLQRVSDQKTVKVTGVERKSVVVVKSRKFAEKALKIKIIPPKAVKFKKVSKKPLRVKIIPPGLNVVLVE